jgi:O-antigen/teichoic acid export membrane protein
VGRLRYILIVDVFAAVLNLVVNLILIPPYGAVGAAVGTTITMIIFNILKQVGLMRGTGVSVFDWHYTRAYIFIIIGAVSLLALQAVFAPSPVVSIIAAALVSLVVVRLNRKSLNIEQTFPELLRIPLVKRLLA